ncbi:hypothetical protein CYFUS_002080 [Cystobacter fuscus]|uniref:Uncharacterized protein n=1 Tax=Cystobacter fuscus TaxID=43 RepID=A0A250IY45_9BACT|nr:hypothetical protein [Cystobacter fuscus]ATB36665.1 hypothetical protein CYFUS_002080 [Cystobacter fuscus]
MKHDSSPPGPSAAPARPARRGRWFLLLVPLVVGGGGLLLSLWMPAPDPDSPETSGPGVSPASPARASPRVRAPGAPPSSVPVAPAASAPSPEEAEREAQRQLWTARLERARFSLESYRQSTRYPHESRPIEEHPDRVYPASPSRKQPLGKKGGDISLRLKQEKVFVVGEESVRFFVGCENAHTGQPLSCEVHSATASEAPYLEQAGKISPVPLEFNDSGRLGDEVAGDGTWTTSFQPLRQGFTLFEGTLRVGFSVRAAGNAEGSSFFDIQFTPAPPATFTGKVREVVEQGSLRLYAGLQVRKPGRYVFAARVDDEAGVPLAYLDFNEELEAGAREVRFSLFGLLLHDKKPDFPLRLRDVEGFLLRERGDPDRELVKTLAGVVHTTGEYPLERFSSDEWTSEERQRYLDEFSRDVADAQAHLDALAGKGPP